MTVILGLAIEGFCLQVDFFFHHSEHSVEHEWKTCIFHLEYPKFQPIDLLHDQTDSMHPTVIYSDDSPSPLMFRS